MTTMLTSLELAFPALMPRPDVAGGGAATSRAATVGAGERGDEELMVAYRDGDEHAFRVLFARYTPRLVALARRHVWAREDASDLVQQTFLQVHRARHDYHPDRRFRAWVTAICLNLCRDHLRRRARRPEASLDLGDHRAPHVEPFDPGRREQHARVQAAVRALPDGQREVIDLHWWEELSFHEIAEILGGTEIAVRVRAFRGYEKLRATLRDEIG